MNRGLLGKAWRESWLATLFFGAGLALFELLLAYALLDFVDQMSAILTQVKFAQRVFHALLGTNLTDRLGPEVLESIAWVHPAVLALVWAHAIIYCTRVPAGEVDRGTIDVLLGLPVSRWQIYRNESLVWLGSGIAILLLAAAGNVLGRVIAATGPRIDSWRLAALIANLFSLYLAVGGLTWLVSALSDRRGRAMAVVFVFLLGSFLLNFLTQFWSMADRLSFLSLLHYYSPLLIMRDGLWPIRDVIVLFTVGGVLWVAGGVVFSRRDLATL